MTPPRAILRVAWALHRGIFDLSGGRIGTRRPGERRPGTLFVHTVGHRSGQPRRTGLFYIEDDEDLVVVASNAGEDVDPGWYRNLLAGPDAEVEVGGRRLAIHARETDAAEAERLWPRLDAVNPEFASYRRRTARRIPIVILEPRPDRRIPGPPAA